MQSIQQVTEEFLQEIYKLKIIDGIGEFQKQGQVQFDKYICRLVEARIQEVDQYLFENPKARKGWQVEQKGITRDLVTQNGNVHYERRYYKHKRSGCRSYLVDSLVNVAKGERLEVGLAADLCVKATQYSYQESAKLSCYGSVSRQTVMNQTRKVSGYEIEKPGKREATVIHIQADEDHVAMQDGRNVMPKLLAIHEPVKENKSKRSYLPNRYLISSYNERVEDMWERVGQEIESRYGSLEDVKLYIHGDGASWIKGGVEHLEAGKFVLDKFHVSRFIHRVTNGNQDYIQYIWERMEQNDIKGIRRFVKGCVDSEVCAEETGRNFIGYISNNWAGIQIWYDKNEQAGISCAEGLVSHIFADRLSSRPKAWMDKGLKTITDLRVYVKNGGKITPNHMRPNTKPQVQVTKRMQEQLRQKAYATQDIRTNFCCSHRHTAEYALYRSVTDNDMKF